MYHYTVHQYGNIHAYMYIVRSGTKAFLRERVARGGGGDSILDRLLETVHSTVLKQKIAPPPRKNKGGGGGGGTTC